MSTIAERVAAGAALLDEREPGWVERVDMDRLDLQSSCQCVLGQLATDLNGTTGLNGWGRIVRHFGLRRWSYSGDPDAQLADTDVAHGFNVGGNQMQHEYRDLTAEWKRVITERRAAS